MLYPAHSRVGRGNLVLNSVPHFRSSSGGITYWGSKLNAALLPLHQSEENISINVNKYLISSRWGSHPQPVDFTVTLWAPALRLTFWQANATTTLLRYRITKPVCFTSPTPTPDSDFKIIKYFWLFLFNKIKVRFNLCKIFFFFRCFKTIFFVKK